MRIPDMRSLLVTILVAVLLQETCAAPVPQIKGKHEAPVQDTEKVWGARVVEPPEKDDQLVGLLPVLKSKLTVTIEKPPGAKAWVETEDILARVRSPQQGPEPDHDHLYHPLPEEAPGEERHWLWAMLFHQVLQGPEKDQDHIYHPVGGFREP